MSPLVTTTTERPEPASFAVRGAEMRRRRKLAGYTLAAFAERAKISLSLVAHLESGRRRAGPPVFARICDALDIPVENRQELVAPEPTAGR